MQERTGTSPRRSRGPAVRLCAALGLVGALSAGVPMAGGPVADSPAEAGTVPAAATQPAVTAPQDVLAPLPQADVRLSAATHAGEAVAAEGPAAAPRPVDPAGPGTTEPAGTGEEPAQATAGTPEPQPHPAAPDDDSSAPAQAPVPAPGVVTGTLTRLWAEAALLGHGPEGPDHDGEDDSDHDAQLQVWLETPTTSYRLRAEDVEEIADGAEVTARLGAGPLHAAELLAATPPTVAPGSVVLGADSTDSYGVAAAAVTHEVTLVQAVPAGASADTTTTSALAATINGPVSTYWSQQSRGTRNVRVVRTHDRLQLSTTCADPTALWGEVARRVGWQAGTRKHLVVHLPDTAGCGAGLGTVGGGPDVGGRLWVSYDNASIIAHELGHNMGLGHSNGLLCSSTSDGAYASGWAAGCAEHSYRDYYDVMGISWSTLGSLAAPHAESLGLLTSTEKLTTAQPTRVKLVPMSGTGLRVLRIDDPAGAYYVEYRTPTSWDSWLSSNYYRLDPGVLVHRRSPHNRTQSVLLDGSVTGGTRTSDWQSALPVGATLTTASKRTSIRVESADASGATIAVGVGGVWPGDVVPPTNGRSVQVRTPSGTSVQAGTTVFSGVGTAPEGTLLWEVSTNGVVRGSGWTTTGSNGAWGEFTVPVSLPAGTHTFTVRVPDDSDGEAASLSASTSPASTSTFSDSVTVSVR